MVEKVEDILGFAQTIVIGNGDPEFRNVVDRLRDGQLVVDFVRVTNRHSTAGKYDGICW
jgi:GDP-mannose 6-dehydrogenase